MPRIFRAVILCALAGLAGAAAAQDVEKEGQKPARESARRKSAGEASLQSELQAPAGPDVTYEQVLADPDNVDLNYRFALGQVRRGDLKGAAATLERVLLVKSDLAKVRLVYAIVLYRLDNLVEAEREFDAVKDLPMSEALRGEIKEYLRQIALRRKKTRLAGDLSLGFEYDTNRNAAPASGNKLFADTPIPLSPDSQRRNDTSLLLAADVGVRRDLGLQGGHELFANASYFRSEQTLVKALNLQAYSLQAGSVYKSGWANITSSALFDHILLSQQTLLRDRGVDVRFDHRLSHDSVVFAEVRDVFQQYSPTTDIPIASDRTGILVDATFGVETVLGARTKIGLAADHAVKHAAQDFDAFTRDGLGLTHTWLLGRGAFLLSAFSYNHDRYWRPDVALSAKDRRDDALRADATVGLPLSWASPRLKDLLGTIAYEYYQALSTVQNYAYTNNKVSAMLTYRWEVGL